MKACLSCKKASLASKFRKLDFSGVLRGVLVVIFSIEVSKVVILLKS